VCVCGVLRVPVIDLVGVWLWMTVKWVLSVGYGLFYVAVVVLRFCFWGKL